MKQQLSRLEKVLILDRLYTRSKLIKKYANATEQYDLFSGLVNVDINEMYELAEKEGNISSDQKDEADEIIEAHLDKGIEIIDYFDNRYPDQLRKINDAPFLLYAKGNTDALKKPSIAIVGTRQPSDYGKQAAFSYAKEIASKDICIVSGLAVGIDSCAHRGALSANGTTVAVLASNPDKIYPAENRELANEIINSNGVLISEHPIGYGLYKSEFVQRNRLQSGLSICSLIIESTPQSGSATQAEWSYKQGRKIFVIQPDKITMGNSDFSLGGGSFFISKYNATGLKYGVGLKTIIDYINSYRK